MTNKKLSENDVLEMYRYIDTINKTVDFLGKKVEETDNDEELALFLRKLELESDNLDKFEQKYGKYIKSQKDKKSS